MKKSIFPIAIILILLLVGCTTQNTDQNAQEERLTIAATFFPLYDLTKMIVGSEAEVFSIVPKHAEPHGFTQTPQDIVRLNGANMFVTLGIEFEEFEQELVELKSGQSGYLGKHLNISHLSRSRSSRSDSSTPQ